MPYDDTEIVRYLRQSHDTTLLTDREKHLVGLAVTLTRGCQVCTRNRIEKVGGRHWRQRAQWAARVRVVSSVNAGVTAATAREGFRLADASASDSPCTDVCAQKGGKAELNGGERHRLEALSLAIMNSAVPEYSGS